MDHKALYVVKANRPNLNGYSTTFAVATGHRRNATPIFEGEREIPAGSVVLALDADAASGTRSATLYEVKGRGNQMVATPLQPGPGDLVRLTCLHSDLPYQSGSLWIGLVDRSFAPVGLAAEARLEALIAELGGRVPPAFTPPTPAQS